MICSESFTEVTERPIHINGITTTMHSFSHVTDTLTSTTDTSTHTQGKCQHMLCTIMVRTGSQ